MIEVVRHKLRNLYASNPRGFFLARARFYSAHGKQFCPIINRAIVGGWCMLLAHFIHPSVMVTRQRRRAGLSAGQHRKYLLLTFTEKFFSPFSRTFLLFRFRNIYIILFFLIFYLFSFIFCFFPLSLLFFFFSLFFFSSAVLFFLATYTYDVLCSRNGSNTA